MVFIVHFASILGSPNLPFTALTAAIFDCALKDRAHLFGFDNVELYGIPGTLNNPYFKWMLGETPVFHVMFWSHPTETTILKWMFWVPGSYT